MELNFFSGANKATPKIALPAMATTCHASGSLSFLPVTSFSLLANFRLFHFFLQNLKLAIFVAESCCFVGMNRNQQVFRNQGCRTICRLNLRQNDGLNLCIEN